MQHLPGPALQRRHLTQEQKCPCGYTQQDQQRPDFVKDPRQRERDQTAAEVEEFPHGLRRRLAPPLIDPQRQHQPEQPRHDQQHRQPRSLVQRCAHRISSTTNAL